MSGSNDRLECPPDEVDLQVVCVCLIDGFCLCACGFRGQGPPVLRRRGQGDRECREVSFFPLSAVTHRLLGGAVVKPHPASAGLQACSAVEGGGRAGAGWRWDGEPGKGGGPGGSVGAA